MPQRFHAALTGLSRPGSDRRQFRDLSRWPIAQALLHHHHIEIS